MKKVLSLILSTLLLVSLILPAAAAQEHYSDISGHWAKEEIDRWSDLGIIQGYNGKARPDDALTRGEFAVILDRMMKYQNAAENKFSDLDQNYYTDAILKATKSGVIEGLGDGTVHPTSNITRQDAMCMIVRAFDLHAVSGITVKASDQSDVSDYAASSVSVLESLGYVKGREDGKLYPKDQITRAEMVQILDNMVSKIYSSAGTYTQDNKGNAVVNTAGVSLKDMKINGNLIIAPGVGEGDCTLENVAVNGDLVILGGGVNSIKILGTSSVTGTIYVNKSGGAVRVYDEKGVSLPCVVIEGKSDAVTLEGAFTNVIVNADVKITLPKGTTITTLTMNAPADFLGEGTIGTVTLTKEASGATFTTKPNEFSGPSGVAIKVGTESYTWSGTSLNANNQGNSGGSSGGGGATSISVSAVTLYVNGTDAKNGIAGTAGSGAYTFDLSKLDDSDQISGIQITTSTATTYQIDKYSIKTNEIVPMSTFLTMLGVNNKAVTMAKIRSLGTAFTATGSITGGSSLAVTLNVGTTKASAGYYSFTNSGTTVTATLNPGCGDVKTANLTIAGSDPVKMLVTNITDQGATFQLAAQKGSINFTQSYTYSQISSLTLADLVQKMNTKYTLSTLNDLKGITVTITYGSRNLTLIMA
jgi:hypothetical protein